MGRVICVLFFGTIAGGEGFTRKVRKQRMSERKNIEIEPAFNQFVEDFGGELVSGIVGKSPDFSNADYYFREDSVIAELKCLKKDFLKDLNYQRKLDVLYERWVKDGLVPLMSRRTINSKDLPERCQRDVIKIFKKPLHNIITKANHQIKQTKEKLNVPNAKGVLLLANDGNYSLESDAILQLVTSLIRVQFSGINYVAYFTVNMPARLRTMDGHIYLWAMAHGEKETEVSYEFLNRLGDAWKERLDDLTGYTHKAIDAPKEVSEHILFVR